jgi:hypothetical protein
VVLVPFKQVDLSALRWLRSAESPAGFVLSSGDQSIAEIHWMKSTGSLALAETADSRWTLKRIGFLSSHLTLRVEGAATDFARVTMQHHRVAAHVGDSFHRIDLVGGRRYRFRRAGLQVPAWQITTDDRADPAGPDGLAPTSEQPELVHIEPVREGRVLVGAAVIVSELGRTCADLPPLLALVWYAVVLAWFEDELLIPLSGAGIDLPARD